ncbi:MAG: HDOD domain-containing protein [Hydrogenophilales bacterium]|nr:HDOD domain-containing protein [Hydrogenophilales bacterium]
MSWNFIPRPFRRDADEPSSTDAEAKSTPHAASSANDSLITQARQETVFLARQAIFDATEKVRALQLLVRKTGLTPEAAPESAESAARLIVNTLNTFGAAEAMGDKLAWVTLPEQSLDSDIVELLPKAKFILEYPAAYLASAKEEARCAQLLKQGFNLAYTCQNAGNELSNVASVANYVVYDLALQSIQDIAKLDRAVKPHGLQRLVRNINTRGDFDACKAFCFDLYQGNFFAKPETLANNRVDPARVRVVDIFNLVMNKADVALIEDAFKHDVALCYSLLCYINSVGIGLQYKVSSIKNAVMLLGYDFLWRWLSLLIYAGIDLSAAQRVLLNTAIIRGRVTELLGQMKLPEKEANSLFVVGVFSLLDALMGVPIEQALARLNLPQDVSQAISLREGKYAPYFELALAFESGNLALAERLCAELEIDLTTASRAHLAAIEWAGMIAK